MKSAMLGEALIVKDKQGGEISIPKFSPTSHFTVIESQLSEKESAAVRLDANGIDLVALYYRYKYGTEIQLLRTTNNEILCLEEAPFALPDIISRARSEAKTHTGDFRKVYFIETSHKASLIYIKEKGKECVLLSDTLGLPIEMVDSKGNKSTNKLLSALSKFWHDKKCPIYFIPDRRQTDVTSCGIDGLISARRITQMGKDGQYKYLPGELLEELQEAKGEQFGSAPFYETILPNFLLVTVQSPHFLKAHQNRQFKNDIVHTSSKQEKPETLDQFRQRYSGTFYFKDEAGNVNSKEGVLYNKIKGHKYAKLVERMFYCKFILSTINRSSLTADEKNALNTKIVMPFMEQAKKLQQAYENDPGMRNQALQKFSAEYLEKIMLAENILFSPSPKPRV